jgi:hypothetical protein
MKRLILVFALLANISIGNALSIAHRTKTDSVFICKSKSAYAYHAYECRGLARCTHQILKVSKAEAIKMGYKPCGYCYR